MLFLRASLFNFSFYGLTIVACILCVPGLFLGEQGTYRIIRAYLRMVYMAEKYILGLDYEVRGLENLPPDGAFIVAAKHQSPYETLKLHYLFNDPAIVLKKELLNIPIWGKFLSRIKPIAIDRSQKKEAMKQVIDGAARVKEQGRPIIIFPQGTRVYPWQTSAEKPYKAGAMRIQSETDMDIVPLAMNTGLYWARKGWMKYPGKVIFEFLPPLKRQTDISTGLKQLEKTLEETTTALQNEAMTSYPYLQKMFDKRKAKHQKHVITAQQKTETKIS